MLSPVTSPVTLTFQSLSLSVLAMNCLAVALPALSNLITLLSAVRRAYPLSSHSGICKHFLLCLAPKPGLAPSSVAHETSTRCPLMVCVAAKVKVEESRKATASRRFIRSPIRCLGYITDARIGDWLQN